MHATMKPLFIAALMIFSAQVIADDTPMAADAPTATTDKHQMMKDCMAKQKAMNSNMTHAAMKTVCENQVSKPQKDGNDLATAPQATPKN
jgi:hypothetical protein